MTFENHVKASSQLTWTNVQNLVHQLRLVAPRTRVYVHLDQMGLKSHAAHQYGRVRDVEEKQKMRNLPHHQFLRFEWIEEKHDASANSVPRMTQVGALPLTVDEVRKLFRRRQRRTLKWRKMDTSTGIVKPEELLLLFADIANKSFPRLRACPQNTEREMNSIEAMEEYNTVYGEEKEKHGNEDVAIQKAKEAQRKIAHLRVRRFIEELTLQQRVEALVWHIGLGTTNKKDLRRRLQTFVKGAFAYPSGFGMGKGPRQRGNTLGSTAYFGKKTHPNLVKASLGN